MLVNFPTDARRDGGSRSPDLLLELRRRVGANHCEVEQQILNFSPCVSTEELAGPGGNAQGE